MSRQPPRVWTPERLALVTARISTEPRLATLAAVNALPGPPVRSPDAVTRQARVMRAIEAAAPFENGSAKAAASIVSAFLRALPPRVDDDGGQSFSYHVQLLAREIDAAGARMAEGLAAKEGGR